MAYERFFEGKTRHFLSELEVDLESDVVWGPGEGDLIRAKDKQESINKKSAMKRALSDVFLLNKVID